MAYPQITLNQCNYAQITQNKTGDLAMVYKPLQNLVKNTTLGNFTTEKLNFDRYNAQDMIIVDEFDGSTNIIINDDNNQPRLINSGFSVQEDNTFLIPEHYTNSVTNIYDDETFDEDTQLLKLYNKIPTVKFLGLGEGGFKCGSYIFYFRLADSVGNMSNVIQHSSVVQIFIGENGSYEVRMGMEDENANKSVKFKISDIDSGFDYLRVFYERTSTGNDRASTTLFYMIDQNFPIVNGECTLTLTGEEQTLGISLSDLKNEYADIAACKTHAVVDNTLFLANTQAYVHEYAQLQRIAWCIYPEVGTSSFTLPDTKAKGAATGYYDPLKVYNNVGYWPDEYYRFGIVFIYNNNQLSPVFNIQGYDMQAEVSDCKDILLGLDTKYFSQTGSKRYYPKDYEPDNFIFDESIMSNSKGVIRTPNEKLAPNQQLSITFNLKGLEEYIQYSNDLTSSDRKKYQEGDNYLISKFLQEQHGIKGFFFVRQKRIPTILAQGLVVGLTTKDYGSIPILQDGANTWKTKSFLSKQRLVLPEGSTIMTYNSTDENGESITRVVEQALLVPDAELQEATYNQIFTSQEFALYPYNSYNFKVQNNDNWWEYLSDKESEVKTGELVKLTAVPKDTKIKTNGDDYFSTLAGCAEESYKTEDIFRLWRKTPPQELTTSGTLIRGRWGYYVGMSTNSFKFGDVVSIKKAGFIKNANEQNLLEFQDRFSDNTFFSPVSTRYSVDVLVGKELKFNEFGGDCFPSMFTHRMMNNFIDDELPTNNKIINPGCWVQNYAVRCTAEILDKPHSNLTGDSAGFYIPSPSDKKSSIVSLVFGILTGNLGIIINAAKDLADNTPKNTQKVFANEVAPAFEVYTGNPSSSSDNYLIEDDDWAKNGGYDLDNLGNSNALEYAAKEGKIKKVNPKEQEQNASGLNLKALFKSDDKWELHGVAQINRADVNAVSFGQWITFPILSSMNIALRDVDFSQATEEASFNRKRGFYPLEKMDIGNKLPESNVINGAAKKTIHKNSYPVYKTVPFRKQEYFNRIYWSKPNTADAFLNSYRMVYADQFKEYNKEFGDITKILPINNNLLVVFDHGIGILPVDRSIKNEIEASPYLASRNVLPAQVSTLTSDYGSMWKNSVLQTPEGVVYGVDTVAKKIWRTQGSQLEFISDHKVTKFLNDYIKLSEFDYRAYQGHLDVKTHYNAFKKDVIFTLVKDIPVYSNTFSDISKNELLKFAQNVWNFTCSFDDVNIGEVHTDEFGNGTFEIKYKEWKTSQNTVYPIVRKWPSGNGITVVLKQWGYTGTAENRAFIIEEIKKELRDCKVTNVTFAINKSTGNGTINVSYIYDDNGSIQEYSIAYTVTNYIIDAVSFESIIGQGTVGEIKSFVNSNTGCPKENIFVDLDTDDPVVYYTIKSECWEYIDTPKKAEIQNGKVYINDIFTGVWCDVESWEPGTVWSLCYNEVLGKFTTFYDWYPIESCNVNNIYFSFDQEQIDNVYDKVESEQIAYPIKLTVNASAQTLDSIPYNKFFIDKAFVNTVDLYRIPYQLNSTSQLKLEFGAKAAGLLYVSFYYKSNTLFNSQNQSYLKTVLDIEKEDGWHFVVCLKDSSDVKFDIQFEDSTDIAEIKAFNLDSNTDWDTYTKEQSKQKPHLQYYKIRDYNPMRMYLWKHGQAGLYDNQGKILPTNWYGNQHEFNFEFVANEEPFRQKIFNNLWILSNKTAPDKFEYEVVGEGYEWFEFKPIVEWINKKAAETSSTLDEWFSKVLGKTSNALQKEYPDFPALFDGTRKIVKLPYLAMKHTDKKGSPERPHYKWDQGKTYWDNLSNNLKEDRYSYNCSEPCLVEDDQLNEVRVRTESLGNDMKKYGRIRGNMQYLEDLWKVEIRPIQVTWCYLDSNGQLQKKKMPETRHRDKYIKVKIRYSGEDLALIQQIVTIFDESFA